MDPPVLLVLKENKEDESTSKYVTELQYKAPPPLDEVMDSKT